MKLSELDLSKIDNDLIRKLFFSVDKENYDYADYVIVYGCHMKQLLDERLDRALSIVKNKRYGKLVLTGGVGAKGDFDESEYMHEFFARNGIDESSILVEDKSRTTEDNNVNVLSMLRLNDIANDTNIVLVTQEAHMLRLILHWKKLVNNPNIHFYYDYVDGGVLSYRNVINSPELLELVKSQIDKTKKLIEDGTYADFDIPN